MRFYLRTLVCRDSDEAGIRRFDSQSEFVAGMYENWETDGRWTIAPADSERM